MPHSLAVKADLGGALTQAWRSVLLFVPRFLAFLAILVVGWLIARVLLKLVKTVLARVHFDRLVERGGINLALRRSRLSASDLLTKIVYYSILLLTLQLGFRVWGPNPVSDLIKDMVGLLPRAGIAIVIMVIAIAIGRAVREILGNVISGLVYGRPLANVVSWFIIGVGVIAALNQLGVATTVASPILVAVLATIGGILVVGVGGGLVRPMRTRWEEWLDRVSVESQMITEQTGAYHAARAEAEAERARQAELSRQQAAQQRFAEAQSGALPNVQHDHVPSANQTSDFPTQPVAYTSQRTAPDEPTIVIQPIEPQATQGDDYR